MKGFWLRVQETLEVLGGGRPSPVHWPETPALQVAWGLWWAFLLLITIAFSGRGTKFVYIDF